MPWSRVRDRAYAESGGVARLACAGRAAAGAVVWLAGREVRRSQADDEHARDPDGRTRFAWLASLVGAVLFNVVASLVPLSLLHTLKSGTGGFDELYEGLTSFLLQPAHGGTHAVAVRLPGGRVSATPWGEAAPRGREQRCNGARLDLRDCRCPRGDGAAPGPVCSRLRACGVFPSAVALVLLAWGLLSRAPRGWAVVVCLGMVVEFLGCSGRTCCWLPPRGFWMTRTATGI